MQQAPLLADGRARAASCHARAGAAAGRHEGALLLQGAGPRQRLQRGRAAARHPQRPGLPGPARARARARRAAAVRAGCLASACRGSAMRSSGGADVCARAGARWPACPFGHGWVLDRGMQRKAAHPTGSHACILLACAPGPAACLHERRTQGAVAARPAAAARVARAKRRGQACARARRAWPGRLAGNVRLRLLRGSRAMKGGERGCRGPCQVPHGLPRVRVQLPHPLAGLHRISARAGPQAGAPRSRKRRPCAAPAPRQRARRALCRRPARAESAPPHR